MALNPEKIKRLDLTRMLIRKLCDTLQEEAGPPQEVKEKVLADTEAIESLVAEIISLWEFGKEKEAGDTRKRLDQAIKEMYKAWEHIAQKYDIDLHEVPGARDVLDENPGEAWGNLQKKINTIGHCDKLLSRLFDHSLYFLVAGSLRPGASELNKQVAAILFVAALNRIPATRVMHDMDLKEDQLLQILEPLVSAFDQAREEQAETPPTEDQKE